jgi:zinc protease
VIRATAVTLTAVLALGCASPVKTAEGPRPGTATKPAAPEAAAKPTAPKVLVTQLDNGMTVIIAERHAAPVCTVQVWVRCGSTTEEELLGAGVSHYVEHMLFKGTKRRGPRDMDREIRAAGGGHNAYTSVDRTVYYVSLPSRNFDVALDCLSDAVMNSAFDPKECEREREVIIKEINRGEDSPGRAFYKYVRGTLYRRHPRRHPVIGYRPLYERISREQLVGYYRRQYVPNNMIFVAVGDLDTAATLEKIRKAFAAFPRSTYIEPRIPSEPKQVSPRTLTVRDHHFRTARLLIAWPTVSISSPDMYALDMAAMVLGAGRTSRLHRRLVEKDKLVYSVSAGNYTPESTGFFEVSARLEEKNVARAVRIIDEEIARLTSEPVTAEEMRRTLARHRARDVFRRESVEGLASELAGDYFLTGDVNFSRRYLERLAAVTDAEVKRVLAKYLVPAHRNQIVALPPRKSAPRDVTPPAAGDRRAAKLKRLPLPGGARMLVYERHDDPIVAVSAVFLGGVRFEPPEKNGVSDLMAKLLTRGTRNFTAERMDETVAEHGGSLSGYGGRNSFGVTAKFLSADLPLALQLTAEVLARPTFPAEELEKLRTRTLARIRQKQESIWAVNEMLLDRLLYAPHPYSRQASGTEKSVKGITREDLAAFHGEFCRPDNMVLCVAGDVAPERARELVLEQFGDFLKPREKPFRPPEVPAIPELKGGRREEQARPRSKQAMVTLAFRGLSLRDPDRFALGAMRAVLSGMGSRLFDELRDKRSLAYSVGCYTDNGLDPGGVIFYIATKPSQVDTSLEAFWQEIRKIRSEPVSDEEINRARNSMLGALVRRRQRINSICQGLAYKELYGLKAESYFTEKEEIVKLTKDDVLAAAKRYLDEKNYVITVTRPPKKDESPEAAGRGKGTPAAK